MLRAIREIQPRWIVGENVLGLTNWSGGLVFEEVQTDLEAEGYEVQAYVLPACGVNAPHRRERIFFVAYADKCTTGPSRTGGEVESNRSKNNDEQGRRREPTEQYFGHGNVYGLTSDTRLFGSEKRQEQTMGIEQLCEKRDFTDTERPGLQITESSEQPQPLFDAERNNTQNDATHAGCSKRQNGLHGKEQGREATKFGDSYTKYGRFSKFPITEPTICGGNDGVSSQLDGITFPKWRNESIKAYGNAIVPQVVYQIFNAISVHEAEYGWR